jgi:hypothetical protein
MEIFNFKELNDFEVTEQYRVKTKNRFAAFEKLENILDSKDTVQNIKTSVKNSLSY